MEKLIVELIALSIAKAFDIEFSECPDFNDAMTMNILITRDGNGVIKDEYYESDRITMHGGHYNEEIINEAIEWLSDKER